MIGNPSDMAKKYFDQGVDEIVYIDLVASLFNRDSLIHVVEKSIEKGVRVPLCVGGGIRTLEDISRLLRAGADKVAINSGAHRNPELITKAAEVCMASSLSLFHAT